MVMDALFSDSENEFKVVFFGKHGTNKWLLAGKINRINSCTLSEECLPKPRAHHSMASPTPTQEPASVCSGGPGINPASRHTST